MIIIGHNDHIDVMSVDDTVATRRDETSEKSYYDCRDTMITTLYTISLFGGDASGRQH